MDNPVMGAGMLPGSSAGVIDLEHPFHRLHQHHLSHPPAAGHHQQLLPPPPPPPQHHHRMQMPAMAFNAEHHPAGLFDPSTPPSTRGMPCPPSTHRGKGVPHSSSPTTANNNNDHHQFHSNTSDDDDDPSFANEENGADGPLDSGGGSRGKKGSPWHRMKWTDEMVRLLIAVVACVGDDGAPPEVCDGPGKRKHPSSAGGAILQKKGKWKTVSKLMLEKGCYVSPQQCEDKFNDLNKRYKRLNEILGRGTTCDVVENPALLDQMPHIPARAKEDVRKILSSKHLFYREMCAYHNGHRIPNSPDGCPPPAAAAAGSSKDDGNDDDDEEESDDDDDDDADFENDEFENRGGGDILLQVGMGEILQDGTKPDWEQREWLKKRGLQLEEERVDIQERAFRLERRRFKWRRFRSKKDMELERMRLENEKTSLENERNALQVRRWEAELDLKWSGEAGTAAGFGIH